jgi:putative membrane protein
MVCEAYFTLHACLCTKLKPPKTIARKEILQAQYKMTYRLWYIITWPSYIGKYFLRIGCCFTDLGKAYKCLGCKTWLCICIVLYHGKCQQIFNQLQNEKLNTQPILCVMERGATIILLR